ncbi:AtpZ/AtpI family protein [Dehalococcoidia bacterium]|nr:AtpZ/AtpI family protein [Dehalococcoidia bacterium]
MTGRRLGIAFQLLGIGWYVSVCIGIGGLVGHWLGQRFDFDPLLTLIGIGTGIAAAVYGMYRMLIAVVTSTSDQEKY